MHVIGVMTFVRCDCCCWTNDHGDVNLPTMTTGQWSVRAADSDQVIRHNGIVDNLCQASTMWLSTHTSVSLFYELITRDNVLIERPINRRNSCVICRCSSSNDTGRIPPIGLGYVHTDITHFQSIISVSLHRHVYDVRLLSTFSLVLWCTFSFFAVFWL